MDLITRVINKVAILYTYTYNPNRGTYNLTFRVQGSGFRVLGFGFLGSGFWV